MKKLVPILALLIFGAMSSAAMAITYAIPPLPEFPDSGWDVGSALTYNVAFTQGIDDFRMKTRIAILETVQDNATNETLYWIEFDLTEFENLPAEHHQFFIDNYGELPRAIRLNMLVPRYDLLLVLTDPSKVYNDLTEPGFIRKLYFQYNLQNPYDVDIPLISSLILPLAASDFLGEDTPEDFVTDRNLGITMVEDSDVYTVETSESVTTTDAGNFNGWLYSYTAVENGEPAGTAFYTADLPILPVVTFIGDWFNDAGPGHIEVELVSYQPEGATTDIIGTPVVFDLNALIYGTFQSSREVSGSGQTGTSVQLDSGVTIFYVDYTQEGSDSNFIVWIKDSNGYQIDLLANEIGSCNVSKTVTIPYSSTYYLDISCVGNGTWRIWWE